jgi:nitroimidazol reductase NimA-like FMN-containing flavoprotein (pyridoxamine 5'-phosphate oxidase superfamily)
VQSMIETMKDVIKENDLCVLATVSGTEPHCSLMAYMADDECREIYMISHKTTKKYTNLLENPFVSLLIDTRLADISARPVGTKALTVNGTFQQVEDRSKRELIRAKFLERHPHMREFAEHPAAELVSIKVTSLLLLQGIADAHFEKVDVKDL